ncbi:MAG: hypothetical protein KGL39_02675 [Patescibacteria group bacterium]|nr:hypothetical protein [Patescibacteria group bacterium]
MKERVHVSLEINPHLWRKMKQAERNMMMFVKRGRRRYRRHRARRWALTFKKLLYRIVDPHPKRGLPWCERCQCYHHWKSPHVGE